MQHILVGHNNSNIITIASISANKMTL